MSKDVDLVVCKGVDMALWSIRSVYKVDSLVEEVKGGGVRVTCELPENVVCVWSMFEGVEECVDVLGEKRETGACEFVCKFSCKSGCVGCSVSEVAPVSAESRTTPPIVSAALSVEEELVKLKVCSLTLVMSVEEGASFVVTCGLIKSLCVL